MVVVVVVVVQLLVGGAGLSHSVVCGGDGCGRLVTSLIKKKTFKMIIVF